MAKNGYAKFESVQGMNVAQKEYIKAIKECDAVVAIGPPGTSKTYIASSMASEYYFYEKVGRIILIRPTVPATPYQLGYLPGSLNSKLSPWVFPVAEVLEEKLGYKYLIGLDDNTICPMSIAYLRGYNLDNSFIIVDEAQCLTIAEIQLILTRIGKGSKLIMTGDLSQTDLQNANGLQYLLCVIEHLHLPVPIIRFGQEHIVRSEQCQMWVSAFTAISTLQEVCMDA